MGRRKSEMLELKSVVSASGLILGFVFLVVLVFPARGLRCYECTNDDDGCFDESKGGISGGNQIPDRYIKECAAGATGCVQFEAYYDYLIGNFLHRSCYYKTDKDSLKIAPDADTPGTNPTSTQTPGSYPEKIKNWKESRSENGLPPPVLSKKEIPNLKALEFAWAYFNVDLGNSGNPKNKKKESMIGPESIDVTCSLCDNENDRLGEFDKSSNDNDWTRIKYPKLLPLCAYGTQIKSIQCKGAYGCASFWEVRNDANRKVSRVWRDCWYPGEMKCLRSIGGLSRSLSSKGRDEDSCKAEFYHRASSRQSLAGSTAWHGIKELETLQDYGTFLDCVKNIRARSGKEFSWSIKSISDIQNPGSDGTKIRFYFCSPKENCAGGKELTPPTTTTTTTTTTKPPTTYTTTLKSSTLQPQTTTKAQGTTTKGPPSVVNPSGGDNGIEGGEIWEGCESVGAANRGLCLQSYAYLVSSLILSLIISAFN